MKGGASIVLCTLALAVGCGPTLGVRGQLAQQAREQGFCEHLTRVAQLTENAFEVDGCGLMMEYTDTLAGSGREFQAMTPAASLAVADTLCRMEQLTIVGASTPTHRSFAGCGVTTSYGLVCMDEGGCHWEREGAPVPSAPALPTAPVPAATEAATIPPPPGASQ